MPTPDEIIKFVNDHEQQTTDLRRRMDEDYSLWRLDEYNGDDDLDGFDLYTTSDPGTFGDKVTATLSAAERLVRVHQTGENRQKRNFNNKKELFALGILEAGDERLKMQLRPRIQDQLSWYCAIRGWYACLAVLQKLEDEDSAPVVNITPWDPRNTYWQQGKDGLVWACYVISMTRRQIKSVYDVDIDVSGDANAPGDDLGIRIYDWWDGEINTTVTQDMVLKPETRHGSPRVPVALSPVGAVPLIWDDYLTDRLPIKDVGESIFKNSRRGYSETNFNASVLKTFAARSLTPSYVIESKDGRKVLKTNPFLSATEIPLAEGDKLHVLEPFKIAQEMGPYLEIVGGEVQRATLPSSAFGQVPVALSGFAINSLSAQQGSVLHFPLQGLNDATEGIVQLIVDQYADGAFAPMTLTGSSQSPQRDYFSEEITPEMVKVAGKIEITHEPSLPQDDAQQLAMIQQLRDTSTGAPLVDDRTAREKAGFQDADQIGAAVLAQQAMRSSPVSTAFEFMRAMAMEGEEDQAQIWQFQFIKAYLAELLQLMQLQALGGAAAGAAGPTPGGGGQQSGSPPGLPAQVLPSQMQGVPQVAPDIRTVLGAMGNAGQPRPGGSNALVGPRGQPLG